jgi:hypothetical protein
MTPSSRRKKPRRNAIIAAVLLAAIGVLAAAGIVQIGFAEMAASRRAGVIAHQLRPAHSTGTAEAASEALATGSIDRAEALALTALRHSPLEIAAVRTLGQVREARRPGSGDGLMLLAARLGWRDRPTQQWVVQRAILAGEFLIATQRAEALIRVQRDDRAAFALFRMLALDPRGRPLVVQSLARRPYWRHDFFSESFFNPGQELNAMVGLLDDLGRTAAPPSPVEARPIIDGLATAGRPEDAWRLYRRYSVERGSQALLPNGNFERTDIDFSGGGNSTVFDWRVFEVGQSTAGVEARADDGGNRVLFGIVSGPTNFRLAERTLVLRPGQYEIAYRMRASEARAPEALGFTIRCGATSVQVLAPPRDPLPSGEWQQRRHRFTVPAGCRSQILSLFGGASPEGSNVEAVFDDVRIAPVNGAG